MPTDPPIYPKCWASDLRCVNIMLDALVCSMCLIPSHTLDTTDVFDPFDIPMCSIRSICSICSLDRLFGCVRYVLRIFFWIFSLDVFGYHDMFLDMFDVFNMFDILNFFGMFDVFDCFNMLDRCSMLHVFDTFDTAS